MDSMANLEEASSLVALLLASSLVVLELASLLVTLEQASSLAILTFTYFDILAEVASFLTVASSLAFQVEEEVGGLAI